jgi:hypothetical protein
MPKVKFNKLVDSISGRIGDIIFYQAVRVSGDVCAIWTARWL